MIDRGLLGGSTTEHFRLPGIKVAVEVDNRDRAVSTVDRPEERKNDRVVASQSDNARVVLAICRDRLERLSGGRVVPEGREGRTMEKLLVTVFDLLDRELVVVRGDGNVTAIDNLESSQERVDSERNVVAAVQSQPTRPCPDARWSESGARTVGSPGVLESCTISLCSRERYD